MSRLSKITLLYTLAKLFNEVISGRHAVLTAGGTVRVKELEVIAHAINYWRAVSVASLLADVNY